MSEANPTFANASRSILFIFLGDPALDRRVQNFIAVFSASGWSVRLLYGVPGESETLRSRIVGADAVRVSLPQRSGALMFWRFHREITEVLKRETETGVVLACDLYSLRAAAQFKSIGRAKLLVYDARELYTALPSVARRPAVQTVWKGVERQGLSATDLILVTAPHDAQAIFNVHRFLPRSILVRNLPLLEEPSHSKLSLRDRFKIGADKRVVVYIGGLQKGRGLQHSIQAHQHLPSDVVLVLLGSGNEEPSLRSEATRLGLQDRVIFGGAVESTDVIPLLEDADVGLSLIEPVSRSYELALPSKLFEYMMVGIPIVSSELQHVRELFPAEPWIAFTKMVDAKETARAIEQLLTTPNEVKEKERSLARESFHFAKESEPLVKLLLQKLKQ